MKKLVEDDHKKKAERQIPYRKLKKDVEHEKYERAEKIDINCR